GLQCQEGDHGVRAGAFGRAVCHHLPYMSQKRLWFPESGAPEDGHLLPLRRAGPLPPSGLEERLIFRAPEPCGGRTSIVVLPTRKSEEPDLIGPAFCLSRILDPGGLQP